MPQNVRVRFAPSPTGALHVGGLRTALYNYLFAKKHNGKFILRIEDTDRARYVEGAEDYIKAALAWCNIRADESPEQGGDFAPYKQSERKALYQKYVQQMIEQGTAYYAFDTGEELDAMRAALQKAKAHALSYNSITRMRMKNSLTLSPEEVRHRLDSGKPYVVRMKIMAKEDVRFTDIVRGTVKIHTSALDDKILMKSDGMPTYHLANVVDDYLMKITHVIRGEEWLPSTPLHVLLYRYLGWEKDMPQFAHLPLLLKPNGQGKLSKRDAEKQGFPIFPMQWHAHEGLKGFREEGYLSAALVNFLALLGWNPGTADEIFTMEELASQFTLEQVNKSGVKFDIQKALWFNRQYIRALPSEALAQHLLALAQAAQKACEPSKALAIAKLLQERIDLLPELLTQGEYFFEAPKEYAQPVVRKKWNLSAQAVFQSFAHRLDESSPITPEQLQEALQLAHATHEASVGQVMPILRVALTGEAGGPDLMKIMEVIGNKEVKKRIVSAQKNFSAQKL